MFELFVETVNRIPSKAVLSLLKREHDTILDALRYQRIKETPDINSILRFCQFMNTVVDEAAISPTIELPIKHVAFYRNIVTRLIEAGEIPEATKAKFDTVFSSGFLRSLATR
jgi:hypothetical protein